MTQREIELLLPQFEGLIFRTAVQIIEGGVELELDDIRQLLRIKIWRAIAKFDQTRTTRMDVYRFAFGCMRNMRKDIEKRPRRYNASIDELRTRRDHIGSDGAMDVGSREDWFDSKYLAVEAEDVFFEVEDQEPELLDTLTGTERQVVELRRAGRLLQEIDRELGLSRAEREKLLGSVREKLGSLDPRPAPRAPTLPLPGVEPRRAPVAA